MYPYPSEGKKPRIFTYFVNRRIEEIQANTQAEADEMFQEKFGFAPSETHRSN